VATLAQQTPTVKPLGGKSAGQAGCVAAPQTLIPAMIRTGGVSDCERRFYFLRCDHAASPPSVPKAPAITSRTVFEPTGAAGPAFTAMIYSRGMSEQACEMRRQASVL
jgi:hypothetical protein